MLFQNTSVTRGTAAMVVTGDRHGDPDGSDRDDADLGQADAIAAAEGARLADQCARDHRLGRRRVHRRRRRSPAAIDAQDCCCWARRWRSPPSRPACPRSSRGCCRWAPSSSPRPRRWSRTSPTSRRSGATSAINTDKTGTLTMNQMMVSTMYASGDLVHGRGRGLPQDGGHQSVAGAPVPDFTRLALGLVLDSDATVADDGGVVGDPTEAALVVLAAKLGVDARRPGGPTRDSPRCRSTPTTSSWRRSIGSTVEGASTSSSWSRAAPTSCWPAAPTSGGPAERFAGPHRGGAPGIDAANQRMGEKGLRVLAFAARFVERRRAE